MRAAFGGHIRFERNFAVVRKFGWCLCNLDAYVCNLFCSWKSWISNLNRFRTLFNQWFLIYTIVFHCTTVKTIYSNLIAGGLTKGNRLIFHWLDILMNFYCRNHSTVLTYMSRDCFEWCEKWAPPHFFYFLYIWKYCNNTQLVQIARNQNLR